MNIRRDRIERAQALMRQHGLLGLTVMNHDDYRYFLGFDRAQPRAVIPFEGPPILVAFAAEEPELRATVGEAPVRIFSHLGEQIQDVVQAFRELMRSRGGPPPGAKPRVGMQLWFETPAFLVDLFRRVNPQLELVSSDPVMDALRMVKEPAELDLMRRAQEIAVTGMNQVRERLTPGAVPREIAAEALYTMMKAGAEGTSTPLYINVGVETCWLHGHVSARTIQQGELVLVDPTPRVEGYCANLARTCVIGAPDPRQRLLLDTYDQMREATRRMLVPGVTVSQLDAKGREICEAGLRRRPTGRCLSRRPRRRRAAGAVRRGACHLRPGSESTMTSRDTSDVTSRLARAPLFEGLPQDALARIVGLAHPKRLDAAALFFSEGGQAEAFFVLMSGRVKLTQVTPEGHQVVVRMVGPGDAFGGVGAFGDATYPVSAEAVEPSVALAWVSATVRQLLEAEPTVALNAVRFLAARLHELQERYRQAMTERVERRVARALLRLVHDAGRRVGDGVEITFPISRQDIAEMTGTTLYTVSRLLSGWEERGIVRGGRQHIVLTNPHGLVAIAEDLPAR